MPSSFSPNDRQPRVGAGLKPVPDNPPHIIEVLVTNVLPPDYSHRAAASVRGRKTSKQIAALQAQTAEAERVAAEAAKLLGQLCKSLKPLRGKLWSVHGDALFLVGPAGGIPISATVVPVLETMATGGRHAVEGYARAALDGLVPRLAVVGLRVDRRREGVRIAKARA